MKFDFYIRNAAANNGPKAKMRESTRMCAIAFGLSQLGHRVRIVDAPDMMYGSRRWKHFEHLFGPSLGGFDVRPAESMQMGRFQPDVAIKCGVSIVRDEFYLNRCGLLVAHEYAERFYGHEKLLPVPFLIHDRSIDTLIGYGLFGEFLENDLDAIREAFPHMPEWELGMNAFGWPHRRKWTGDAPEWADIRLYENHTMTAEEHMHWLCAFKAGLCMPGDTPKTNLPPLLAMLGIPIVMWPIDRFDTPPINTSNAIMFESWEQVHAEIQDAERLRQVAEHAMMDYLAGWSPLGQSRLISERLA